MTTKKLVRHKCCLCGSAELGGDVMTQPIPIFQGCTHTRDVLDTAAPMKWVECSNCGCVQLFELIDPSLVYQGGHAESTGTLWKTHHEKFARFMKNFLTDDVLELGGGVGLLAKACREAGINLSWTNVEPNPMSVYKIDNYNLYEGFFDDLPSHMLQHSSVVFSHCLEHVLDLGATLDQLSKAQSVGNRVFISWPDLQNWINFRKPGALNWEHTFFITEDQLVHAFAQHGYNLLEVEKWNDHSLFFCFEKSSDKVQLQYIRQSSNLQKVQEYFFRFERTGKEIARLLDVNPECSVYLCPASVYSQYIFAHVDASRKLVGVLDGSANKIGKNLYGTGLMVSGYQVIQEQDDVIIILCSGGHDNEISNIIKQNNKNAQIHVIS